MSGEELASESPRPNVLDVEAVVEHIQETDDVVMCQPRAPAPTRFLWGDGRGGVYLMVCGKCNHAGDDAVRRFTKMQNGRVEMTWRDSSLEGVMDAWDDQMQRAEA